MAQSLAKLHLVAISFVFLAAVCMGIPANAQNREAGEDWLSWTQPLRSSFIEGFITGYLRGASAACNAADDLFELGMAHSANDRPSERCYKRVALYSKKSSVYADVITQFYRSNSQYKLVPVAYLLSFLKDGEFKDAAELSRMAKDGRLRTNF